MYQLKSQTGLSLQQMSVKSVEKLELSPTHTSYLAKHLLNPLPKDHQKFPPYTPRYLLPFRALTAGWPNRLLLFLFAFHYDLHAVTSRTDTPTRVSQSYDTNLMMIYRKITYNDTAYCFCLFLSVLRSSWSDKYLSRVSAAYFCAFLSHINIIHFTVPKDGRSYTSVYYTNGMIFFGHKMELPFLLKMRNALFYYENELKSSASWL